MVPGEEDVEDIMDLPNIGVVLAQRLTAAGIRTPADLRAAGSIEALVRIRGTDGDAPCANMLYALEGAIRGVRWHTITADQRTDLWRRYQARVRQ